MSYQYQSQAFTKRQAVAYFILFLLFPLLWPIMPFVLTQCIGGFISGTNTQGGHPLGMGGRNATEEERKESIETVNWFALGAAKIGLALSSIIVIVALLACCMI